jgi:hypothetical protein
MELLANRHFQSREERHSVRLLPPIPRGQPGGDRHFAMQLENEAHDLERIAKAFPKNRFHSRSAYMEEHDARGDIHFRASRSPDLRVAQEQLRGPLSALVYIVDDGKDKMATSLRTGEDEEIVNSQPLARISPFDLDNLMMTLEVEFVKLAECVVSPGSRLTMAATNAPGIHYDLMGMGRMIVGNHPAIDLQPRSPRRTPGHLLLERCADMLQAVASPRLY